MYGQDLSFWAHETWGCSADLTMPDSCIHGLPGIRTERERDLFSVQQSDAFRAFQNPAGQGHSAVMPHLQITVSGGE